MARTTLAITADFILGRATMTWSEILFGIDKELLALGAALDLARVRLSSETAVAADLIERAQTPGREAIRDVVRRLTESERPRDADSVRWKWLYLTLAWIFEHRQDFGDPLQEVEEVYADFGYPQEIESFVRSISMRGAAFETKEAEEQRLYAAWTDFLRVHRFATDLRGNDALEFVTRLRKLRIDGTHWETEYIDDSTGEVWVLYYPDAGRHGGGIPRVRKKS